MSKLKKIIKKLTKFQKITCLILILGFVLLLTIGIPTLARYKNRSTIVTASVWDGSIASSYRKGTGSSVDPYVISNGSELAYFYTQLLNNNYENTYFTLTNDIVLNKGIFNYDSNNGIQYIFNDQTYYVGEYTNKYYDNVSATGTEIGTINTFNPLNNFKGNFDGASYRIYGLYITNQSSEELSLFTNLQGNVHDLYVENAIIYGGTITAGIASTTNNATLKNVMLDGFVIGKKTGLTKNINTTPITSVINLQNIETSSDIDLTNNIPFEGSEIISTSITGNYVINGATAAETSIKINGITVENGSFEIDLGTSISSSIPVLTSTTSITEATLTFTNLSYNIVYNYSASAGIVAISNNSTIENTINKASIYGFSTSGGLVGVTTNNLSISQSYNTGDINSTYVSGGLIGTIEKSSNNIIISKSYNTGSMNATNIGGLIGVLKNNTGNISISNVFNTSTTNYSIGTIESTIIDVTNAYFVNGTTAIKSGTANGNFVKTTINNLQTKSYVVNNLTFTEFVSFTDLATNNQNVWVYDNNSIPILFVDDILDPIANIHVSLYTWNNLSTELSTVRLDSNITFSIKAADELVPLKEIYYYISNSSEPLTKTEISQIQSWNTYSDIVQISEEGFYVIYAKVVGYDDNVTYMNTDLLVLDFSGSSVSIAVDDNTWTSLRSSLGYVYIDRPKNVSIEAVDNLSGISSIKYYVTNQILSEDNLNQLSDSTWTTYSNGIQINEIGTYIVYAKVVDNCNFITYVNSDYIVFSGYTENDLIIGRNDSSYMNSDHYITDKSTLTLNISYTNPSSDLTGHTHNLMSNILLPLGAKLTLIDNILDKVYKYEITTDTDIYNYNNSCDAGDLDCEKKATYPFTLFKEVGAINIPFTENTYYNNGVVNENFTIVLDLSSTNISTNYNDVMLYMELHDANDKNVRPTLYSTIGKFNIYSIVNSSATNASLYLTTNYAGNEIVYNSDSSTNISITSGINYKYVNGFRIIDTTYEDKKIGVAIKLVDTNGNVISKEYLKNIIFKVGEKTYYPGEDNIVRIDLESGIADVTKNLTIITYENNANLTAGTYYFKISNYASYDGYYYAELGNTELSVPVDVSDNTSDIEYSFDVIMDDAKRIISKNTESVNVTFDILQNGSLDDPNIRVSLYKKNQLTAYDQTYSIVDLSAYVSNTLNACESNVYYVSTNPVKYNRYTKLYNNFVLDLVTDNFENTGYKYVFDLYDGTKKIGTIEKYFIVK